MLPDCLLDDTRLTETALVGFARLMRYCQQQRSTSFTGSLSKLARIIKISKTTTFRIVNAWEECNLITKANSEDHEMVLHLEIENLWQSNKDYCAEKYPQSVPNWNDKTPEKRSTMELSNSILEQDRSKMKLDNSNLEQIVPLVSTKQDTKNRRLYKIEEGGDYEEEKDTPFSCRHSLSSETQEPEQVAHRSSISIRGIGTSLQELTTSTPSVREEELQKTPSQNKTFRKAVSKKPAATYKKALVSSPPPTATPVPSTASTPLIQGEPRPLTKNEEQYLREQERAAIWKVLEDVLQQPFPYRVRTDIKNTKGMDALIEDHYSPHDIKRALTDLDSFHKKNILVNFTLENLHLKMPGLLAAREVEPAKKPPAHSSRPLDIMPPLGSRRLDGAMMPGVKGVRHD